jgi:hypothetical protein
MKPETIAGAPSYASGAHMWNGTADTLNAKPTSSRATATSARDESFMAPDANAFPMRSRRVLPTTPNTKAIP